MTALPLTPVGGTKARRTFDRLLEATERCLSSGGYPAATTTAIAAEAGVSVGTVYSYLQDRDAALAALFARRLDALLEVVTHRLAVDALLDHGLESVVAGVVDEVLAAYRRHAATFRAALLELPATPAIREVYWSRHVATEAVVVTFLRRAQRAGLVRQGDPVPLGRALLVLIQGLNSPVLLRRPGSTATRAVRDQLARAAVALLAP